MDAFSQTQAQLLPQLLRRLIRCLSVASGGCPAVMALDLPASSSSVRSKVYSLANRIKACGHLMDLCQGKALHAEAQAEGLTSHTFVASALVCLYGKCGTGVEAEDAFRGVSQPDTVLCNAMLAAYVKLDKAENTLFLFRQMNAEGIAADLVSYICALQACGLLVHKEKLQRAEENYARQRCYEVGRALHSDARRKGFTDDVRINTALVCMYSKCCNLPEAENVFLISATKTVVSWNAMMAVYMEQGHVDMPLRLYRQMESFGIDPDHITIVFVLQACRILAEKEGISFLLVNSSKIASLEICRALHAVARSKGLVASAYVGTTLVNAYGKCDSVSDAEEVFQLMGSRTVVSWNAMLSVYVDLGYSEKALLLFRQMQHVGVTPDQQSIVCALHACGNLMKKQRAICIDKNTLLSIEEIGRCLHAVVRNGFQFAL